MENEADNKGNAGEGAKAGGAGSGNSQATSEIVPLKSKNRTAKQVGVELPVRDQCSALNEVAVVTIGVQDSRESGGLKLEKAD